MKIRLMTFHTPKNYGAVLQAFSLMSYLKKFSSDVKVIDYNTPNLRAKYPLKTKVRGIKQFIYWLLTRHTYNSQKRKFEKFDLFVKEKLSLTERYESFSELKNNPPSADIVFTGSDQVFNPSRIEEERKAFYLDFVPNGVKKIAYAASFGVSEIPNDKTEEITEYLKSFNRVAVRENSGVRIMEKLGFNDSAEVLDPVFLNDAEFWRKNAKPYYKRPEDYVFYYRLMNSKESDGAAFNLAREKGLKLVVMTDGLLKKRADTVLRDVGPEEFLFLLDNAKYVVTDSFHGVAFSLIFKKQFILSDANALTNDRALNLMRMFGIEKQAYAPTYDPEKELDYNEIELKIASYIEFSKKYIANAVGVNTDD